MAKDKNSRKKRNLGSYPFISVIFSITLSLIILGVSGLLFIVGNSYTSQIKQNVVLPVYLEKNINAAETNKLKILIGNKPYVRKENGQPVIKHETIEDRHESFKAFLAENNKSTGRQESDPVDILGKENLPFKPCLNLTISQEFADTVHMKKIKAELESYTGVFLVDFDKNKKNFIKNTNSNIHFWGFLFLGLAILCFIIIILLINNTIKIAMFSQRFIIRTMQLVGAKPSFIRNPFLRRTAFHGFVSGVIASIVLFLILKYIYFLINVWALYDGAPSTISIAILLASICITGVLIGVFSARRAVNKYLKMSLDDLI